MVGLAALLQASVTAFTLVKLLGAAYLVYLGLRTLLGLSRSPAGDAPSTHPGLLGAGGAPFRQGLLSNLLNPKIAVLFTGLLDGSGMPRYTPHQSRHTRGTELIAQGQRVEIVQRALGHRDIRSTLGYAELQDPHVRAALEGATLEAWTR